MTVSTVQSSLSPSPSSAPASSVASGDFGFESGGRTSSRISVASGEVLRSGTVLSSSESRLVEQSPIPIDPAITAGETFRGDSALPAHQPTRERSLEERPAKRPRVDAGQQEPGSSLREHFSRCGLEEQLAFLSWLFTGALERCMREFPAASTETQDARSPVGQPAAPGHRPRCKHRGGGRWKRWTDKELSYLESLLVDDKLRPIEAIKKFSNRYPGRSEVAIRQCIGKLNRQDGGPCARRP
ncbi:hypothetical protein VTN49DRAFT_5425 [Thermomyces lanuginosus]|uniref:uncharacterized protein n=1 Tax=Thermomyces lanuginosus TaxID=5541 RepID=UPI0037437A46